MAKKKKKISKGINLLNGINGAKLAKLAMLAIILLAIPVTVMMSRQQQSTQQQATKSRCQQMGGSCINIHSEKDVLGCKEKGKALLKDLCSEDNNIQCCINPSLTTTTKKGTATTTKKQTTATIGPGTTKATPATTAAWRGFCNVLTGKCVEYSAGQPWDSKDNCDARCKTLAERLF